MKRRGSILSIQHVILIVCLLLASAGAEAAGRTIQENFRHQHQTRQYRLHVPTSYDGQQPVPLVFCFHGGGGKAKQMERFSGFSTLSEKYGFIVVYSDAIDGHWNDGRGAEKFLEHNSDIDDVGFIMALLTHISHEYTVDRTRVYAVGPSNGGMFTQRLALEHAEAFAAVATLIASLPEPLLDQFAPRAPIAVMLMNGTDDPFVPYNGGEVTPILFPKLAERISRPSRGRVISTDETVKLWVAHNHTNPEPLIEQLPDSNQQDGVRMEKFTWDSGDDGVSVVLYKMIGGGHTIPGTFQYLPTRIIGNTCRDVVASELIWEFFSMHRKP